MTWLVYVPLLIPALLAPLARRAARALAAGAGLAAASATGCLILLTATLLDDLPALERYNEHLSAPGRALPEPVPDGVGAAAAALLAWVAWRVAAEVAAPWPPCTPPVTRTTACWSRTGRTRTRWPCRRPAAGPATCW
ncbi:hypothetical protein [Dactylosporangium sp. CA-092794]|uniref:hypothetical protein n=1 Tax=Dactylosporangium sp. CA-092794 TaxID=3239929 RepID=UPI003D8A842E